MKLYVAESLDKSGMVTRTREASPAEILAAARPLADPTILKEAQDALEAYDDGWPLDSNDVQRLIPVVRWVLKGADSDS